MNLTTGDVIDGKYEILSPLGAGGFGTVYQARQIHFDRMVALKTLHGTYEDTEQRARFEMEARAIASMKHKNLVGFYGYGLTHDTAYIVMELINGESLEHILRRGETLSAGLSIDIARQICDALNCAHSNGFIHRDLKPANIMLVDRDDGKAVKVIDFGLAKLTAMQSLQSQKLTAEGYAVGSVNYMSPEQCISNVVDERTDIYATGCILQACLTGVAPFSKGHPTMIMQAHLQEVAEPLAKLCPDKPIPAGLQDIVYKALAKKPDERYQSAKEMMEDLNSLVSGKPSTLMTLAPSPQTTPRKTRSSFALAAACVIWVLLIASVVVCMKSGFRKEHSASSILALERALEIDKEKFNSWDEPAGVMKAYNDAVLLARSDGLLNNERLIEVYNRLAQLARIRRAPAAVQSYAQSALDLSSTSGGGGLSRLDATAAMIASFNLVSNYEKAAEYAKYEVAEPRKPLIGDPVSMRLWRDCADAYFGIGDFQEHRRIVNCLQTEGLKTDDLAHSVQQIITMKGEVAILDGRPAEASELFERALSIKDKQGKTIAEGHDPPDDCFTSRITVDQLRAAAMLNNWTYFNSRYERLNSFQLDALQDKSCLQPLRFANKGDWRQAAASIKSIIDRMKVDPRCYYSSWFFFDVPLFVRIAKAQRQFGIAASVDAAYKNCLPGHKN